MENEAPKPPEAFRRPTTAGGRPITGRTRRKIEQIETEEEDENLALMLALEEDEKIAAKLQKDYDNGTGIDDYHRLQSANPYKDGDDLVGFEFSDDDDDDNIVLVQPNPTDNMQLNGGGSEEFVSGFSEHHDETYENHSAERNKSVSNYEQQRASFKTNPKTSVSNQPTGGAVNIQNNSFELDEDPIPNEQHVENIQYKQTSPEPTIKKELNISQTLEKDMKTLLAMISEYSPETIELETKLLPFLPEYIPCIGDIDPIVKIPMPSTVNGVKVHESSSSALGMMILDEPNGVQSDPAVVDLTLRSIALKSSKSTTTKTRTVQLPIVRTEEKNHASFKMLQNWVDTVTNLHGTKQKQRELVDPTSIEKLMAEWPEEIDSDIDNLLADLNLDSMDLTLKQAVQFSCNMLDIPLRKQSGDRQSSNHIDACSVLFTLYSEFKNSKHFGHQ